VIQDTADSLYSGHHALSLEGYMELKKALVQGEAMWKAQVGQIQHGVPFAGEFAPLVAQSIDKTWTSETFDDTDLVLTNLIQEVDVMSPLHEVVTVREYGQEPVIEGFFAEGGVTEQEIADLARKIAEVKYIGVQRSLTDVGAMTGIIGGGMVSRKGLEHETKMGIMSLKGRYETALFHADSDLSPLHFDGLYKQISDQSPAENIQDLRGQPIGIEDFINEVYGAFDEPNYAKVDCILVPGSVLGAMITEATSHGRHDQMQFRGDKRLIYNAGGLSIVGPSGQLIDVKAAPKMNQRRLPWYPAAAGGVTNAANAPPVLGGGGAVPVVGPDASSVFTAADAGAYQYVLLAVGDRGARQLASIGPVNVGAGDIVTWTLDDDAAGTEGIGSLRYYVVYRSPVGGAVGTETFMWRFPRGVAADTVFVDTNAWLPSTSSLFALTTKPESMYVAKLLGTIRRPLAETATSKPFMIMKFASLHVTHPRKQLMWRNAALSI
jgi:hypothetical protein